MLKNIKVLIMSIKYVISLIIRKIKENIKIAYIRSYYKLNNESEVKSCKISKDTEIGKKVWIDSEVTVFSGVKIGDYTCINGNAYIESGEIGKFCSIASNVAVGLGEHPLDHLSTHVGTYMSTLFELIKEDKKIEQKKSVPIIGNDVWIARGAIILRGVTIGDGAVIAANTVVTKNVPPFAIVAGNPSRIIRYRFSEEIIENILKGQWWNNENFYKTKFEYNSVGVENFIKLNNE